MAVCWQEAAGQNSSSWGCFKGMTHCRALSRGQAQVKASRSALNITLWFRGTQAGAGKEENRRTCAKKFFRRGKRENLQGLSVSCGTLPSVQIH